MESKNFLFVSENLSVFIVSDDSLTEDVPDVTIAFVFSSASVIFPRIIFRSSLQNLVLLLLEFYLGSWISSILVLSLLFYVMMFFKSFFVTFLDELYSMSDIDVKFICLLHQVLLIM